MGSNSGMKSVYSRALAQAYAVHAKGVRFGEVGKSRRKVKSMT